MTVSTDTNRWEYDGTGSTTVFPYTGKIFAAADLVVYLVDDEGAETLQTLNTDYTVSGVGAQAGGNVTFTDAPASGVTVSIRRVLEIVQDTSIKNQGAYYPEIHEDQFDRGIMIDQQQQDQIDRSLRRPDVTGDDWDAESRRISSLAAGELSTDAANLGQVEEMIAAVDADTASIAPLSWTFTGDGSTTEFSVSGATVTSAAAYHVTLDGVMQEAGTDYTVDTSSDQLTFATAPGSGVRIYVRSPALTKSIDDVATLRLDLVSVAEDKGASLVGVHDSAGRFSSDNLESVLAEISDSVTDSVGLDAQGRPSLARGIVSIFYDDTNSEVYTVALPIHSASDVPAAVAVDTGNFRLGTGKMTLAQLRELVDDYGWEVASHSVSHPSMNSTSVISESSAEREIVDSYNALRELGFDVRLWVTPQSGLATEYLPLVKRHYDGAFTVYTNPATSTPADVNMAAPIDPYTMTRVDISSESVATIKSWIDYAAQNKTWLVLYDHEPGTDISSVDLTEIVEYIAAADVDVLLPYEALQRVATTQVKGEGPIRLNRDISTLQARSVNLLPSADFVGRSGTASSFPPAYWAISAAGATGTVTHSVVDTFGGNRLLIETDGTNTGADENILFQRIISIPSSYRYEVLTFAVDAYLSAGADLDLQVRAITKNGGVTVTNESVTYPLVSDERTYPVTIPVRSTVDELWLVFTVINKEIGNAATAMIRRPRVGVGAEPPLWDQHFPPVREVASVSLSGTQSIPIGTNTTVIFDTETADTLGGYSTSTGIYAPKQIGWYRVTAFLNFDAVADGVEFWARVDYGAYTKSAINRSSASGDAGVFISHLVYVDDLSTGLIVQAFHNDAAARNLNNQSWAQFEYVGK